MDIHTIALGVHILSILVAIGGILWADHSAWHWFRSKKETLEHSHLRRMHAVVGTALGLLIGSGVILFWPMKDYLLTEPLFLLKMLFVLLLVINSVAIDRLMRRAASFPFRSLTRAQKIPLFISGGVSALCWLGAIVLGLTIF